MVAAGALTSPGWWFARTVVRMNLYERDQEHRDRLTAAVQAAFPPGRANTAGCDHCGVGRDADCLEDDALRLPEGTWFAVQAGRLSLAEAQAEPKRNPRWMMHRERYLEMEAYRSEQLALMTAADVASAARWDEIAEQHARLVACDNEDCRADVGQPCKAATCAVRIKAGWRRAYLLGCDGSRRRGTDVPPDEAIIAAINRLEARLEAQGATLGNLPLAVDGRLVTAAYRAVVLARHARA
jgi:hypothetical protein